MSCSRHAFQRSLPLLVFVLACGSAPEARVGQAEQSIVGGSSVPAGEYPWIAALFSDDGFLCGGTLTEAGFVLTAAHCVQQSFDDATESTLSVSIGALNIDEANQRIGVQAVLLPAQPALHDLALLRLVEPARGVAPLPRADATQSPDPDAPGVIAKVAGWGARDALAEPNGELQQVELPIVSTVRCGDDLDARFWICAGEAAGGKDACQGDSGGPLLVSDGSGNALQAGIVSSGDGCGRADHFGRYTRVSSEAHWIEACVSGSPACESLPRCWDSNENGACDAAEDLQPDGACNRLDCALVLPGGTTDLFQLGPGESECAQSGELLVSGFDDNADARLERNEWVFSRLTCTGDEPRQLIESEYRGAASCDSGRSAHSRSGLDRDGTFTLSQSEIETSRSTCEPARVYGCNIGAGVATSRLPAWFAFALLLGLWLRKRDRQSVRTRRPARRRSKRQSRRARGGSSFQPRVAVPSGCVPWRHSTALCHHGRRAQSRKAGWLLRAPAAAAR